MWSLYCQPLAQPPRLPPPPAPPQLLLLLFLFGVGAAARPSSLPSLSEALSAGSGSGPCILSPRSAAPSRVPAHGSAERGQAAAGAGPTGSRPLSPAAGRHSERTPARPPSAGKLWRGPTGRPPRWPSSPRRGSGTGSRTAEAAAAAAARGGRSAPALRAEDAGPRAGGPPDLGAEAPTPHSASLPRGRGAPSGCSAVPAAAPQVTLRRRRRRRVERGGRRGRDAGAQGRSSGQRRGA